MRVGSLFAGIGGICLGFKKAGASIVWANEINKFACITYQTNFGSEFLTNNDIRNIELNDIPDIDILTAGFPCQPFSIMGKQQGFADPRGTMYFEILRVTDAKRPKVIFLENVKNLIQHDNGRTLNTICKTLNERKYNIKFSVLGANTHANIPQYRDRIFITAFLEKNNFIKFIFPNKMSLTKSINDIVNRNIQVGKSYYYKESDEQFNELNYRMTDNTAIYRIDDSGTAKRAWKICPTLKANMGTYNNRVPIIRDKYGIRKLTPYECLSFQGFPNTFKLPDIPINEVYKQIGNTVCVPVVYRIARRIIDAVN